jgi:phage N-6-adenine-methyltransferase
MSPVLFSSDRMEWETPPEVYDPLHEHHKFTLDPCATPESAKCAKYFTKADNGLAQSWAGERVFMNPPYGKDIGLWMAKAFTESTLGALVVCLVPVRTDTAWWQNYVIREQSPHRFLKGRVKFLLRITEEMRSAVLALRTKTIDDIRAATKLPKVAIKGILANKEDLRESAPFPSAIIKMHPRCKCCRQIVPEAYDNYF